MMMMMMMMMMMTDECDVSGLRVSGSSCRTQTLGRATGHALGPGDDLDSDNDDDNDDNDV